MTDYILYCKEKGKVEVDYSGWVLLGSITLHREDGPAIEYKKTGSKEWFLNGKHHREDGPAVEYANGSKHWYINGKLHREDGPAVEWVSGVLRWYIMGKELKTIPKYVLNNYMKVNNYTLAHLLTDSDPLVRESAQKYKWS